MLNTQIKEEKDTEKGENQESHECESCFIFNNIKLGNKCKSHVNIAKINLTFIFSFFSQVKKHPQLFFES